jgi:hypothetical protein
MYMRLGFSVAAHANPDILLVDEVLAVGDEAFKRKCLEKMNEFKRQGRTIVVVSHNLPLVERWCDAAILLEEGRVVAQGFRATSSPSTATRWPPRGIRRLMGGHVPPRQQYARHASRRARCGRARREREWLTFFGTIADHIAEIAPKQYSTRAAPTGFLVEALRDRGGGLRDRCLSTPGGPSRYPAYCRQPPRTPRRQYDLIVCIEVLEHLSEDEARRALASICRSTGEVLFSSTPDDFHRIGPQQREAPLLVDRAVRRAGFQLDVDFDAGFVAAHAMRFKTGSAPKPHSTRCSLSATDS